MLPGTLLCLTETIRPSWTWMVNPKVTKPSYCCSDPHHLWTPPWKCPIIPNSFVLFPWSPRLSLVSVQQPDFDCSCCLSTALIYPTTAIDREAMEEYIGNSMVAGWIEPSPSPVEAGFFFGQKKDDSLHWSTALSLLWTGPSEHLPFFSCLRETSSSFCCALCYWSHHQPLYSYLKLPHRSTLIPLSTSLGLGQSPVPLSELSPPHVWDGGPAYIVQHTPAWARCYCYTSWDFYFGSLKCVFQFTMSSMVAPTIYLFCTLCISTTSISSIFITCVFSNRLTNNPNYFILLSF